MLGGAASPAARPATARGDILPLQQVKLEKEECIITQDLVLVSAQSLLALWS
jgi:hypothetical protein